MSSILTQGKVLRLSIKTKFVEKAAWCCGGRGRTFINNRQQDPLCSGPQKRKPYKARRFLRAAATYSHIRPWDSAYDRIIAKKQDRN